MKLHVETLGSGPPLIILHGMLGSGTNWRGVARQLENRFTVVLPDLVNHGRSPRSSAFDVPTVSGAGAAASRKSPSTTSVSVKPPHSRGPARRPAFSSAERHRPT